MTKEILNFIRKVCVYLLKKEYLKPFKKIGICEVTDNEIICTLNEKKSKKKFEKYSRLYELYLLGFLDKDKNILEACGLNKKINI